MVWVQWLRRSVVRWHTHQRKRRCRICVDRKRAGKGEQVALFVCSISKESVAPDESGNLIFSLTAGFDQGLAEFVVTMPVEFVTGAAEIPVSEKTRTGAGSGHDNPGSYPSGHIHVGKPGDFDQDGFLDGEFVLSGISPPELIIAEGDPILIIRPFTSDIPVSDRNAAIYALNGIVNNYQRAFNAAVRQRKEQVLKNYLDDIRFRLTVIGKNIARIKPTRRSLVPKYNDAGG